MELRKQKCFIDPRLISRTSKVIGKGVFGEITLVFYDGIEHACKTLKRKNQSNFSEQETLEICQDLLNEANIMEGLEHENILRLVGISQVKFIDSLQKPKKVVTSLKVTKSYITIGFSRVDYHNLKTRPNRTIISSHFLESRNKFTRIINVLYEQRVTEEIFE